MFAALIPVLAPIVGRALDKVLPDTAAKDAAQSAVMLELAKLEDKDAERITQALLGQLEVNKVEAAHRSVWVAGWRPGVGWSCAAGIAWLYVIGPIVEFVARLCGWKGAMPDIDAGELSTLLLAMLGVAGLRTFDKVKGTADDTPLGKSKQLPPDAPVLGQNAAKVRKMLKL